MPIQTHQHTRSRAAYNTYKITVTKLTPNILTSYSPYVSKVHQVKESYWISSRSFQIYISLAATLRETGHKTVFKFYCHISIVPHTTRSKLENTHELNNGQSREDRVVVVVFFSRDLGLQNHREITAPWPSCAHALTIHNAMHFSNALFSFGKTSILKWGNVSFSLEVF